MSAPVTSAQNAFWRSAFNWSKFARLSTPATTQSERPAAGKREQSSQATALCDFWPALRESCACQTGFVTMRPIDCMHAVRSLPFTCRQYPAAASTRFFPTSMSQPEWLMKHWYLYFFWTLSQGASGSVREKTPLRARPLMPALTFSMKTPCQQPSLAGKLGSVLQVLSDSCTS